MSRFSVGLAGLIGLTLVLAGCQTAPVYPLMTPLQVAQNFGYDEHSLGGNKFEILYVTPQQNAIGFRYDTSPTERVEKDLGLDLATLRAALLAQQSGWKGFEITDKNFSTDNQFWDAWYDGGWGGYGGFGGWGGRRWGGGGWGGWRGGGWGGWGDGFYYPPERRVQVEVKISVTFTNDVKPGQFLAQDVIQQVTGRYPNVFGPTPPPPPPPPPNKGV
jgi:hypothetical protein